MDIAKSQIGSGSSDANGLALVNPTPATSSQAQNSPPLSWQGAAWGGASPSASLVTKVEAYLVPTNGYVVPPVALVFAAAIGAGAYQDMAQLATTGMTVTGTIQGQGGARVLPLPPPSTPTVTPVGTGGSTQWWYVVTAVGLIGETVGSEIGSTSQGNATLSGSNYNQITWPPVPGAIQYNVYRVYTEGSPSSLGLILQTDLTTANDNGSSYISNVLPPAASSGPPRRATRPARRFSAW